MALKNILYGLLFLVSLSYGQDLQFPIIPGWQVSVETQVYDSNNLWDLIDGAADLYLEYSFVDLHLVRYKGENDIEIKVEVYKHSTPLDAFGIYSQERDPGYKFIQIGLQGYIEEGILNFLDGDYYIKLSTLQKGNAAQDALLMVAKMLDDHFKQENKFPPVFKYFPAGSKLPNSEKYISQNFLGHSFLKSVTTVKYDDEFPFTAFIIDAGSKEEAIKVLNQFISAETGAKTEKILENHYLINDPLNGVIEIIMQKQFLFGVMNCLDKTKKENFLNEIKKTI